MKQLETVAVPEAWRDVFGRAETYVRAYFSRLRQDVREGHLAVDGERYIQVRGAAISIELFDLVRKLYTGHGDPEDIASSLVFDLAQSLAMADAADFRERMGVEEPLEAMSVGPVLFAWLGWSRVELLDISRVDDPTRPLLIYDHPNSFEADAWLDAGRSPGRPICAMNAGYSSGWATQSFGRPLIARELRCRAQGHSTCRFLMAPEGRVELEVKAYRMAHPDEVVAPRSPAPRVLEHLQQREEALLQAQRLETVGRLAGSVANDFNNLLMGMMGAAEEILEDAAPGSSQAQAAQQILEAAEQAGGLTRRLLALADQQLVQREPLDLGEVVQGLRQRLLGALAPAQRLVLPEVEDVFVAADRRGLEAVLGNLVTNALEAGAMEVVLVVEGLGDRVVLEVRDDGEGLEGLGGADPFAPFVTTRAGRRGLGLASARGILRQLGGELTLYRVDGFTIARVELPGAALPVEAEARPPCRPSVLLMDDEPMILGALSSFLERRGFEVHTASSGVEGVGIARSLEGLDLVMSDVLMPGCTGPEAVAAIRAVHPSIGIVFMTGFAEGSVEQLPEGALVLQKPFGLPGLVERLHGLLDRS